MIYVNQEQLDQVKYLIEQSSKGFHILFETDLIRKAFDLSDNPVEEPEDEAPEDGDNSIEKHIENMILQPTILSKRAYLENLEPKVFSKVIKTYFSIVENNIIEAMEYQQ
ncbi:MAG: hypothetical protein AB7F43_07340 [Bacteriovoracia bacterium]